MVIKRLPNTELLINARIHAAIIEIGIKSI